MPLQARDWIEYHAATTPTKVAMVDLMSERKFTYAQAHERVARVAGFLKSKGIKKGRSCRLPMPEHNRCYGTDFWMLAYRRDLLSVEFPADST